MTHRENIEKPVLSAGSLKGTEIVNPNGDELGHLEEIMLDVRTGRVAYAVMSFGGLMGIGDKLFAVPWQAIQVDEDHELLVMNVDKDRLKNAPGFDKNNWPQTSDPQWIGEVYSYYGFSYS